MTSSNGNISRVTGSLCGEFTGPPSFDVFFDLRLNKRLSKQLWGWWFEMLSCPLRHPHNEIFSLDVLLALPCQRWGNNETETQWPPFSIHFQIHFLERKLFFFKLKCHWNFFQCVQSTVNQHWFRHWLGTSTVPSHYMRLDGLLYQSIYVSLSLNELMPKTCTFLSEYWLMLSF